MANTALVTGSAGFIGYFTVLALLDAGWKVVGFDALSDYYDVDLKKRRHAILSESANFTPFVGRLEEHGQLRRLFQDYSPDLVIHLAAQAGVRHSIDNPASYVQSNLVGTAELLEAARTYPPKHLMLASTSSVYGANEKMPFLETDNVDSQMSFYAATKRSTEAMAHSYSHLYGLPTTVFRFFTVYGPWGRPDMAHFKFTKAILAGEAIDIYNHGEMRRDFTYIDDLVDAMLALAETVPNREHAVAGDSLSPVAPHRIVNIGNGSPTKLMDYVAAIENACGVVAQKNFLPMQPGDVFETSADTTLLIRLTGKRKMTRLSEGIQKFVEWYRWYYQD